MPPPPCARRNPTPRRLRRRPGQAQPDRAAHGAAVALGRRHGDRALARPFQGRGRDPPSRRVFQQFGWLNTVRGNLKTSLGGACHAFNFAKYGRRYLATFAYRFNRRSDRAPCPCAFCQPPPPPGSARKSGYRWLKQIANQDMSASEGPARQDRRLCQHPGGLAVCANESVTLEKLQGPLTVAVRTGIDRRCGHHALCVRDWSRLSYRHRHMPDTCAVSRTRRMPATTCKPASSPATATASRPPRWHISRPAGQGPHRRGGRGHHPSGGPRLCQRPLAHLMDREGDSAGTVLPTDPGG